MQIAARFGKLTSSQNVGGDAPKQDTPFRIGVLGDFSGRGARGEVGASEEIGRRKARKVDRGNLDDLMAKLNVALGVAAGGGVELVFKSLDDFHPDAIHGRVSQFEDLDRRIEKTDLMNAILHDPGFQALESAWRGLDWLLQNVARCGPVEVKLIDLSAEELVADVMAAEELEASGLYQILVDQPAQRGDLDPWSALVGLYLFDPAGPHVEALGRVAKIARQASAPFLAGADPRVLDSAFALDEEQADAWGALRALPESSLLGLATPRFLLRPPFGEETRSIEAFEFEEYTGPDGWRGYLWGNTALACASLLARSFGKEGWGMTPGSIRDLSGLPMHVTRDEDGDAMATLAEAWLTRPTTERLVGLGLMPLLCVKGRDAGELLCIQSLAQPPKGQRTGPLLGRWGQKGAVALPRTGDRTTASVATAMGVGATTAASAPTPAAPSEAPPAAEETDPELAALLGDLDAPAEPAAEAAPAAEEMDPELAALLGDLGGSTEPAAPAAEEMDPELAALLGDLDAPAEPAADAAPAAEEMDPELAALLGDLGGSTEPAAPAAEEMDPELAALLGDLDAPAEPAAEAAPAAEEMDPELAALLGDLDAPAEPEP